MGRRKNLKITALSEESPLYLAGLRVGDSIITVNDEKVEDDLDFSFYSATDYLEITYERDGEEYELECEREYGQFLEVEFEPEPIRRCGNKCLFCFVDQLPKGLRDGLYIKDEDYRQSFLHGNYVTLSTLKDREMDKIIRLGMSPMYVSVHATDPQVRELMLGNKRAGEILDQLEEFEENGISFHTQIVVCPGINDGKILKKSIFDLFKFDEGLLSIAIVPVGLTKFKNESLKSVTREQAIEVCDSVAKWSDTDKERNGFRRLFIADEYLIKAGKQIPEDDYYEDYAQIENGVGLVRTLLDEWDAIKINDELQSSFDNLKTIKSNFIIITSKSAESYISNISKEINEFASKEITSVLPINNNFFGSSVTVAGLITASDIIEQCKDKLDKDSVVVFPDVLLNYNGETLDGYTTEKISEAMGVDVLPVAGMEEFIKRIGK